MLRGVRTPVGLSVMLLAALGGCASPGYVLFAIGDFICPAGLRSAEIAISDTGVPPMVPMVTILDHETIRVPPLRPGWSSDCWAAPKVRTKGNEVLISAHYTFREVYGPFEVKLDGGGRSLEDMEFFWIDPDGTKIMLTVYTRPPQ